MLFLDIGELLRSTSDGVELILLSRGRTVNLDQRSDLELMQLVKAGHRDAFVALVHRFQRPLLNFFRRMGAPIEEAEDLVQETFIRVFNYRARYEPVSKFTSFLYTLARHARTDLLRKARRRPRTDGELHSWQASAGDGHVRETDARLDVQAALERLSEKLRAVVVLSIYQGLEQREIAEVLGIPLGTVKSRMHLALKQLREILSARPAAV